jgi:hypothetical protein
VDDTSASVDAGHAESRSELHISPCYSFLLLLFSHSWSYFGVEFTTALLGCLSMGAVQKDERRLVPAMMKRTQEEMKEKRKTLSRS